MSNREPLPTQNYYATHLSEVNKQKTVVSTEDIYAENGMLLAKKGVRINEELADRILQHKLLKPVEEQVDIENGLTSQRLMAEFDRLFDQYHDLKHLHQHYQCSTMVANLLNTVNINDILYQKLTVLSMRLPDVFAKSLFCAWLCALIAKEHGLNEKQVQDAFVAGLFHDIGLLHIDPKILYKEDKLDNSEWRAIQSHVIIGYLIFKKSGNQDEAIANAILEHHECCDGTGYPKGKTKDELGILGQILALADSIQAIRTNRFADSGRNLRDILPFLHMNSSQHFVMIYKTMCLIILNSELQPFTKNPYEDYDKFVITLLGRIDVLQDAITVLQLISDLTPTPEKTPSTKYKVLSNVISPVIGVIKSSGMVRDEVISWLRSLKKQPDKSVMRDLNELDLMQSELLWQLKKAVRVINEYIDDSHDTPDPIINHLKKLSDYIHETLD